jgi:hypothetical protein
MLVTTYIRLAAIKLRSAMGVLMHHELSAATSQYEAQHECFI